MKEKTKKEIEARWLKLIEEVDKAEKSKSTPKPGLIGVKVIRRRKGQLDLAIT